ncbi:glycosyltransferase [Dactylosporangium salmoneum]|uniref:glycosyltransferase n=1 Tax=Dactylosporangium salmoneum TaxID=53361 RepID=UPI0031CF7433
MDYLPVYHDEAALGRLIRSADVVVLPYDSSGQVTSGVLTAAVAAGVPVVATPFPHAVELLTNGSGLLVPHRCPAALAAGIRWILIDPGGVALSSHARPPTVLWPAVAARYETLAERLRSAGSPVAATVARAWTVPIASKAVPAPSFAHLARLTDDTGVRARAPRHPSPPAGLLHRRRGPRTRRHQPGSRPLRHRAAALGSVTWRFSPTHRTAVVPSTTGSPTTGDGPTSPGSATGGDARCGAWARQRPAARHPGSASRR